MAKVYTTVPGLVAQIGRYGPASNDVPAEVPEAVAAECAGDDRLRVETDEPRAARKGAEPDAAPEIDEPKRAARKAQKEN